MMFFCDDYSVMLQRAFVVRLSRLSYASGVLVEILTTGSLFSVTLGGDTCAAKVLVSETSILHLQAATRFSTFLSH